MKPFPRKQRRPAEKQTKVSRTDPQMARDGKPKASSISITAPCTVGSASSASPLKAANVHDSIIDLGRLASGTVSALLLLLSGSMPESRRLGQ